MDQELFNAVEQGNLSEIEKCLSRGANVLARNSHHTVLHSAVRSDDGEVVKLVLKETQSPCIDAKDTEGDTPLMWTAETGYVNAAQVLLEYGASVEAKNNNGMTALHWAAKNNHIEVMKLLIGKGANVNVQDNYGKTPLNCAREEGHGEIAGYLVFSVAEMFRKEEKYNKAWQSYQEAFDIQEVVLGPNHLDTLRTRHSMAVVLREQGKYSEALNTYQEMFNIQKRGGSDHPDALITRYNMAVVLSDQGKYSKALIILREVLNIQEAKLGSDHPVTLLTSSSIEMIQRKKMSTESHLSEEVGDKKAKDGKIPLDIVREEGRREIIDILDDLNTERKSPTYTSLHDATEAGDLEAVKHFIREGANVNEANRDGWTPLHYAAWKGYFEVVKLLIEKRANTDAENIYRERPIHLAAAGNDQKIVELLIKGVSVDDTNKNGETPLHYATQNGQLEIAEFLIKKGARIHAKSNSGKTPLDIAREKGYTRIVYILSHTSLHSAAEKGDLEAVKCFISRGDDVNDRSRGFIPLRIATIHGHLEVVKLLVDKGANMHDKSISGNEPIHDAAASGRKDIVEFFVDKGASIDSADRDGWTPLHYAAYWGHLEVVKLLIDRGADVHVETNDGTKPINLARSQLHSSIIELLCKKMEEVEKEQESRYSIQFFQEQEEAYLHLSEFVSNNFQNASIESIKQGLYLPSFKVRNVKIDGKCTAITRGLSQALLSQGEKSFLSNLETSAKIYERIAQGKQISKREEKEVFAFSKLLNNFERQLDSAANSLPSNLIQTQGYKTLGDLSNYIAEVKGDFAIHLVTIDHVVAIYRTGDNYAYFDSNTAFISGLKSVMQVIEKAVKFAGYKVEEKGFLVEHLDVDKANNLLSSEDKQTLAKEIKTERQLLAEQDEKFGSVKSMVNRVQLYNFGTKINVEGSVPLLINAEMNLNSKKFQDHLDKKEVSMTAREYLDSLKNSKDMEGVVQATKTIPFIGSNREIEEAEQIRKPKRFLLEQLVKGTINSIFAAVSLS
ncbi:MAG: ankyrin repeat domain-containing protein [Wolbachia endosymbiont of Halictus tumulorum]|nr:ankyrin repeat domain-containing protein [Wolbachia endosymbiont of Halictus tumulorum]